MQLNSSLLTLSVIAVLLPAAFHNAVETSNGVDPLTNAQEGHDILSISHGVRNFHRHVRPSMLMAVHNPGRNYLAFQ